MALNRFSVSWNALPEYGVRFFEKNGLPARPKAEVSDGHQA
jgi:hypothetical protein